ncbi:metalloregulator ArsR/SmtB family transcription factor [Paenibacillus oryzisoli]|uniref:DUF2087 domain-containing protein n=1 Tax=Paenibacillus oryzisoli TaxID=1850517 RepID=UPI003D2AFA3C
MQLDKIILYHKALADPTRIRLLILLADGPLNGQTLAEKLGVTPATVTHHAAKLREANLIHERREKNTIFFAINEKQLRANAQASNDIIFRQRQGGQESMPIDNSQASLEQSVLRNFFTQDGKLKHIPAQLKKKLIVLTHLAGQLEKGRSYTEKELNQWIERFHPDFATLRRELIMHHFMYREHEIYELNPPEMWAKWEQLG